MTLPLLSGALGGVLDLRGKFVGNFDGGHEELLATWSISPGIGDDRYS
jgi:hypothetical protein